MNEVCECCEAEDEDMQYDADGNPLCWHCYLELIRDCLNLDNENIQTILGALDTLATQLAAHSHKWTEGEREIYEQAVNILKSQETTHE